jgi:hypothetical protein
VGFGGELPLSSVAGIITVRWLSLGWFVRRAITMQCNHCLTAFHPSENIHILGEDADGGWAVATVRCPECEKFNIYLLRCNIQQGEVRQILESRAVRPKAASRPAPPTEVPPEFADDYKEACLVLSDSPKASAAVSRRCLQHVLREKAGVKHSDLAQEIQEALDSGHLPSHLAESLDAIRNIGNFAAHPIKSKSTREVVPVEPGEAEWNLEVLEALFDFFFVQPARLRKKRDALNKKLSDVGKPPMK